MTGWGGPNNRINWDAVITIAIVMALGALFAAAMLG